MIRPRALRMLLFVVLAWISVLADPRNAVAAAVRWNLENVRFTDGGSASGFFVLDPSAASGVADFDIKVSGGHYPALEYTAQVAQAYYLLGEASPVILLAWPAQPSFHQEDTRSFKLGFATPAGNGTYPLVSFNDRGGYLVGLSYERLGYNKPSRWVRTGGFITTGEPKPQNQASLTKWTLHDVTLQNGHTASGWFVYDSDIGSVVDFDLRSDLIGQAINQTYPCEPVFGPGVGMVRTCWMASVRPGSTPGTVALSFGNGGPTPGADASFTFIVANALSDKSKLEPVLAGSNYDCCGFETRYQLTGGSLFGSAVPEASIASYLAFALVAFVAAVGRRALQHRRPVPIGHGPCKPKSSRCYLYKSIGLGGLASNWELSQAFPRV